MLSPGGHPSQGFVDLPHDLPLHSGWNGCVWDIGGAVSGRPAAGRGAGQCGVAQCTAKSCSAPRGVCIHSPATYGFVKAFFITSCSREMPIKKRVGNKLQTKDMLEYAYLMIWILSNGETDLNRFFFLADSHLYLMRISLCLRYGNKKHVNKKNHF